MGWHFGLHELPPLDPDLIARRRAELVELLGGEENYKAWLARNFLTKLEGDRSWLYKVNYEIARLRAQRDQMAEGAQSVVNP